MPDDLILHHHDPSPFAEKIRKVFGIKNAAWKSVQIPMVMPKPDLTALTGGYRGTPVLQVGADIYCDSRLIAAELERRLPEPSLLKSGPLVNFAIQHWSDDAVFGPGSALAMHENAEHLPKELLDDREDYFRNHDFSAFAANAAHFRAEFRAHAALIDQQLSDGRAFLLGDAPEWFDVNAYFPVWMSAGHIPSANRLLQGFDRLAHWRTRMDDFGGGAREDIAGETAIAIARAAEPSPIEAPACDNETGLAIGDAVSVAPSDHLDTAVAGTLATISENKIVILRKDERAGALAVHFPRIGYRIEKQ